MNGKLNKKIRKEVNQKIRVDFEGLVSALNKAPFHIRLLYAFTIIFKISPDPSSKVRK